MSASDLERAMTLAGLSAPTHWHEVTGSTNSVASELAEADAPEWTLVGAGHQTAGRGRRGRTWHDRPGEAVMTSLVLRPSMPAEDLGLLTLLAGAAWAEAATETGGVEVLCKWPNDLLIGEAKVGGVLAESSVAGDVIRWAVIGSGLNLVAPEVEGEHDRRSRRGGPSAIGLGAGVDRVALLGGFLSRFRRGYHVPPAELATEVVARWSAVSSTLGRRVAAVGTDGARKEGVAIAVDASGRLVLETVDGPAAVASDEIDHLR
jgi:BirA family biotin operon repressor/biotin-[acetyl-CoA-carboxylase] ligase